MQELLDRTGWSLATAKRIIKFARSAGCTITSIRIAGVNTAYYRMDASTLINSAEAAKYVRRHKL